MNLRDIVRRAAMDAPDSEALVLGAARWSYAELDRRIDALARALLAAGVAHGDRVATLSTPQGYCWRAPTSKRATTAPTSPPWRPTARPLRPKSC